MREEVKSKLDDMLQKIYRSNQGANLSAADWLDIRLTIEEYDQGKNGQILQLRAGEALPILVERTQILVDALPQDVKSVHRTLAEGQIRKFDFVFQLVRSCKRSGSKAKYWEHFDETLQKFGLFLGMDLSKYQDYIDQFEKKGDIFDEDPDGEPVLTYFPPFGRGRGRIHDPAFYLRFKEGMRFPIKFKYQQWHLVFENIELTAPSIRKLNELFVKKLYGNGSIPSNILLYQQAGLRVAEAKWYYPEEKTQLLLGEPWFDRVTRGF